MGSLMHEKASPRRSSRIQALVGRTPLSTRSRTGRILKCTPRASKDFCSPIMLNAKSEGGSPLAQNSSPVRDKPPEPTKFKRKSDLAITPLRAATGQRVPQRFPRLDALDSFELVDAIEPKKEFKFCDLPEDVRQKYCEKRKITELYDWQKDCLSDHRLMRGSNCILSLPTGAGKTLIAEILMLREAIIKKRSAILILPYVAIVQEKMNSLAVFEQEFGIKIEEYAASKGRIPPIKRRKGVSIYVATIEKANMLLNSLIQLERIDQIGLLVVDELHMIGDGSRGAVLEETLTKFLYKGDGQIVGMSATLPNMDQLSQFLRAYVYSTDFRPVELHEYVKIGDVMWKVKEDSTLVHEADLPANQLSKIDVDGVTQLLRGVIPNKSVIIFCPTKKNCENVAAMIAKLIPKDIRERKMPEKQALVAALKDDEDSNADSALHQCLLAGIAYHHSGLTHEERKHIEAAYIEGILCVICATSTLAAGVNLPARRVIIKSPTIGRDHLGKAQYLQMIGRAGRAGFDKKGDSITIVRPGLEERQFKQMLLSPLPATQSALSRSAELSSFLLDLIELKISSSIDEIMEVMRYSFLGTQLNYVESRELVEKTIEGLVEEKLVEKNEQGSFVSTQLGAATYEGNFVPVEVKQLYMDLIGSLNKGIIFSSHFHLLYIISPYDVFCEVNWDLFHEEYRKLSPSEVALLQSFGLSDKEIMMAISARKRLEAGQPAMRLYIALMLQKIWQREPHWTVAERFGVDRGWIQSVLQSFIIRASAIARFSEKQESLWALRLLLPELTQRLSDCSRIELIPLMTIDGVKRGRAHQLYEAGFKTIAAIARADYKDLLQKIEHIKKFQAIRIVNSARTILRDQMDEKMEELEAMGLSLDDFDREK